MVSLHTSALFTIVPGMFLIYLAQDLVVVLHFPCNDSHPFHFLLRRDYI